MNVIVTINQVLDILKLYSEQEGSLLNDFGYGPVSQIGQSRPMRYPYLWVTHTNSSAIELSPSNKTMIPIARFTFLVVDQVNDSANIKDINGEDSFNGQEIISDSFQIIQDIVNFLHTSVEMRRQGISLLEDVTWDPFFDAEDDKTNGVQAAVALRIPYSSCGSTPLVPICTPGTFKNSNNTYTQSIPGGSTVVSDDITITLGDGTHTYPSNIDLNLSQYYIISNPSPGTYVPGTFQLPWNSNSANVSIATDGKVIKTSDNGLWNGGADFIIEKTGNFTLNFNMTETSPGISNLMCGIDYFKANSAFNYTGIDMAFYRENVSAKIYENGDLVYSHGVVVDDTTVYTIQRQSNFIFYKINGTTVRTQSIINLGKMFFTNSLLTVGSAVDNINIVY